MRFEDHLDREIQLSGLRDRQRRVEAHNRQRRRETRMLTAKLGLAVSIIVWAAVVALILLRGAAAAITDPMGYAGDPETVEPLETVCTAYTIPETEEPETEEPEEPIYDVPLEPEVYELLRSSCLEAEIP